MFKELFTEALLGENYTPRQKALRSTNKSANTGDMLGTKVGKKGLRDAAIYRLQQEKFNDIYI